MKITTKTTPRAGFTLIEMIGVLAIIAILTALLIPKVFAVINESKITNAVGAYDTAKSATIGLYGKYGRFASYDGSTITNFNSSGISEDWDTNLVAGDFLEQRFNCKVGNGVVGSTNTTYDSYGGTRLRLIDIATSLNGVSAVTAPEAPASDNGSFDLTGDGSLVNGSYLVEAVIPDVDIQDAREINARIDSNLTPLSATATSDLTGRVKWALGATGPTVTVYIYVASR